MPESNSAVSARAARARLARNLLGCGRRCAETEPAKNITMIANAAIRDEKRIFPCFPQFPKRREFDAKSSAAKINALIEIMHGWQSDL